MASALSRRCAIPEFPLPCCHEQRCTCIIPFSTGSPKILRSPLIFTLPAHTWNKQFRHKTAQQQTSLNSDIEFVLHTESPLCDMLMLDKVRQKCTILDRFPQIFHQGRIRVDHVNYVKPEIYNTPEMNNIIFHKKAQM